MQSFEVAILWEEALMREDAQCGRVRREMETVAFGARRRWIASEATEHAGGWVPLEYRRLHSGQSDVTVLHVRMLCRSIFAA